jgi:hypothetical protein
MSFAYLSSSSRRSGITEDYLATLHNVQAKFSNCDVCVDANNSLDSVVDSIVLAFLEIISTKYPKASSNPVVAVCLGGAIDPPYSRPSLA